MPSFFKMLTTLTLCVMNFAATYGQHSSFPQSDLNPCTSFMECTHDYCSDYNHECLCDCALESGNLECFPEYNDVCGGLNGDPELEDLEDPEDFDPDNLDNPNTQDTQGTPNNHEEPDKNEESDKDEDSPPQQQSLPSPSFTPVEQADRGKKKCCDHDNVMCISCQEKKTTEEVCNDRGSGFLGCAPENMFPPEFECPFGDHSSEHDDDCPCHKIECSDNLETLKVSKVRPECLRVMKDYCEDKEEESCIKLKKRVIFTEPIVPQVPKVIEEANIRLDVKKDSVQEEVEIGITKLEKQEVVAHLDSTRYEDDFKSDLVALTPHGQTFQEPVTLEIPFNYTRNIDGNNGPHNRWNR